MCSEKEMQDRSTWRQLDIFEMGRGSKLEQPLLNSQLACKKYQRSSADKAYHAEDIRTPAACALTLWHLMLKIADSDQSPVSDLCEIASDVDYWQVYSFLRDRTRAVRVDLHLQQPWSTTTKLYIVVHESCLRFEILSMYLLSLRESTLEKYDEKMAHKSCSQIMEPLLNAYVQARKRAEDGQSAYLSPAEPAIRRYSILLILVGGEEKKVFEHLPTLPKGLLKHPTIRWAIEVAGAYATGDYGRFLRMYVEADFLSATILTPLLDVVRQRLLWLMVRSSVPMRRDKLQLADLSRRLAFTGKGAGDEELSVAEKFVTFNGLEVIELGTGKKIVQLPAYLQRGTWDVMHDEAAQTSFDKRLGQSGLPMKCDFPRRLFLDSNLRRKYGALAFDRASIVFGAADPHSGHVGDPQPLSQSLSPPTRPADTEPLEPTKVAASTPQRPRAAQSTPTPQPSQSIFGATADSPFAAKPAAAAAAPAPSIFGGAFAASPAAAQPGAQSSSGVAVAAFAAPPASASSGGFSLGSIFGSAGGHQESQPASPQPPRQKRKLIASVEKQAEAPEEQAPARAPEQKRAAWVPATSPKQRPAMQSPRTGERRSASKQEVGLEQIPDLSDGDEAEEQGSAGHPQAADKPRTSSFSALVSPRPQASKTPRLPATPRASKTPRLPATPRAPQDGKELVAASPLTQPIVPSEASKSLFSPAVKISTPSASAAPRKADGLKMPAFSLTPGVPGHRKGDDLVVYLFQVGRAFSAWRAHWREARGWARWARSTALQPSTPTAGVAATSGSFAPLLAVPKRAPRTVDAGDALLRSRLAAPSCTRCIHRLAVVAPPAAGGAARADVAQVRSFATAVSELFLAGPDSGDKLLASSEKYAWSARLLQRAEVAWRPQTEVSILEVEPGRAPESGGSDGTPGIGSELARLGPVSALLHVLETTVDLSRLDQDGNELASGGVAASSRVSWRAEAQRALAAAQALDPAGARRPAVAVVFAVSVPGDAAQEELHESARRALRIAARYVTWQFSAALEEKRRQAGSRQGSAPFEASEVEAFCVAVTRQSGQAPFKGFVALHGQATEATAWALRRGSGPQVVPVARNLRLHERFAGHWSQHCLTAFNGLVFPFSLERLREGFEAATDACVADLAQLLNSLPPELPEWSGLGDRSARQEVRGVQRRLWCLSPPFEEWLAFRSPSELWGAARRYLSSSLSSVSAPCPAWWEKSAPSWDEQVLRVVAPTRPRLVSKLMPGNFPRAQPFPPLPVDVARGLRRAAQPLSLGGPLRGSGPASGRPWWDVEAGVAAGVDTGIAAAAAVGSKGEVAAAGEEPPPKRRRLASVSEMLKQDASWTDSLLRGVALLVAGVPSGL